MKLHFQIPQTWNDLNEYQYKNIASLLLTRGITQDIKSFKNKLLFYLFVPKLNVWKYLKFRKLVLNTPVSELLPFLSFIDIGITRTRFIPSVRVKRKTFYSPADRLANLTIEEFSAADMCFYNWKMKNSLPDLDRLITILYREKEKDKNRNNRDIRKAYSPFDLIERGRYIPKLDLKTKLAIGLTYLSCRELIVKKYPVVFPKRKEESQRTKPEKRYQAFSPVIISMSMDEIQPLGEYEQVKNTLVDPFFTFLTESLLIQKAREREEKKLHKQK